MRHRNSYGLLFKAFDLRIELKKKHVVTFEG